MPSASKARCHVGCVGDVALDECDALGQRGRYVFARRREEVVEDDEQPVCLIQAQPTQQGRANIPGAGQQRRHSAAILTNVDAVNAVDILGVRIDDVTYAEARALLLEAIATRTPRVVTTPNPEIVMLARRDAEFRATLNRAALNIPDGIGLLLAARLAGRTAAPARSGHRPGAVAGGRVGAAWPSLVSAGWRGWRGRAGGARTRSAISWHDDRRRRTRLSPGRRRRSP